MDAAKHRKALKRLKRLRLNDLVVVEYEDNCILDGIITRREAFESTPVTLKTTGFYQGHNRNYLLLSTERIEDEDDRSAFNLILLKYVVSVERKNGGKA